MATHCKFKDQNKYYLVDVILSDRLYLIVEWFFIFRNCFRKEWWYSNIHFCTTTSTT